MRVLMAIDGSKRSAAALAGAARMLAPEHREADLVCVVPQSRSHSRQHHLCRRAERAVKNVQAMLSDAGITTRPIVKTGSPTRLLIGMAQNYDLAVIAAASHRSGPMAGLGPVSSRVAEHSGRPTLLVRDGLTREGLARSGGRNSADGCKVLIAVDGSEGSFRALDAAVQLFDMKSAEVTLLHVAETPWLPSELEQEWPGDPADEIETADPEALLEQELIREADEILANAHQRLPARITVNTLLYEGLPADEILGEIERGEYDVIAIGASGVADLKHSILGSVSSKVAWNAPCSVLLVPAAGWE